MNRADEPRESSPAAALERLARGELDAPHDVLGVHPSGAAADAQKILRTWQPDATEAACELADGRVIPLEPASPTGLFTARLDEDGDGIDSADDYRIRVTLAAGSTAVREDPYRFSPTLGELDLHLIAEGTHHRLWEALGATEREHEGVRGVSFSVWAPTARGVSVVGSFCGWDARRYPMRRLASGVFELFLPGLAPGDAYKFEIRTFDGRSRTKTDPMARRMEAEDGHASIVVPSAPFDWNDTAWMKRRESQDPKREPMLIYEVHLGSWRRDPDHPDRMLGYREIAPRLAAHVKKLGFTHVELLPVMEHPYGGSWGYQVSGYYAPTSRYGTPDDFRAFVDTLHQAGISVLLDWVPAHFPKDDFALRRFDGTALYEHLDPRLGEHPDWGTLIFNFGRREVRNFLIANAVYWLREFHIDGLRVDAVASMLYLDYSRDEGQWVPNRYGGNENLEAIEFLRDLNRVVAEECPGSVMIAEESTSWAGVTHPVESGGLGFTFKWNMGWMHDTLEYFGREARYRRWHQNDLTFAAMYEGSESFLMPLSHDEVVHGKGSLVMKMAGDEWQKFANLRALLAYQITRPGKKLLFMGTELAPIREWDHDTALDPDEERGPLRRGFEQFVERLGHLYRDHACLWRSDPDAAGFDWIDCADAEHSRFAYVRADGDDHLLVVLNLTANPHEAWRIGVPSEGTYRVILDSDATEFGGSDVEVSDSFETEDVEEHGHAQSIEVALPPLAALVLELVPETEP